MKTSELTGAALDWAVAKCEGKEHLFDGHEVGRLHYSTDWAQGGPIIERERIGIWRDREWTAESKEINEYQYGPTPLIAAMRCYCCSKLGDEVEIPEELR